MSLHDDSGLFTVDAARAERVQVALDYVREFNSPISTIIKTEQRVNPYKSTGRNDLSGTVDVQIHDPLYSMIEIIDYKDGMSPVEAKNNPQLEQYALGVIDDNNLPQDCVIRMTIIQPKLRIKGLPAISSHDMTVKELREIVAPKLVREAAATDDPNAPLVAGDVQCKYCKAKGGCSALANKAMESVGMMFNAVNFESIGVPDEVYAVAAKQLSDSIDQQVMKNMFQSVVSHVMRENEPEIDKAFKDFIETGTGAYTMSYEGGGIKVEHIEEDAFLKDNHQRFQPLYQFGESSVEKSENWDRLFTDTTVAQQSANKDPTTMTNDQLVELLQAAPLMRQMLAAAEEEALNRAKAGQTVPGYKVVHGPGSRAWVHDPEEMAAKLVKMGIPKSAIYVTKLVSPPQAEKLVWHNRKGDNVTLSEKQRKRMETEYVKKSPGRLTLVPESDPRQSVVLDAAPLFSPVTKDLPDWLK